MQTEFPRDRQRAQLGQKVDSTVAVVVSMASKTKLPFGALVSYDDKDPLQCKLPKLPADLDKPLGITIRQQYCQHYEPQSSIAILRKGRIWINGEEAKSPGDPVYIRFAEDGTAIFTGKKEKNAQLKNAIFLEPQQSLGLTAIEVNFFGGVK